MIGGTTVNIAFPQLKGQGLTPAMVAILVPIWGMGIAGLTLLLIAWISEPFPQLPPDFTGNLPDFQASMFTRFLFALVLAIFGFGSLMLVIDPNQEVSLAFRLGFAYGVASAIPFIFFLMFRYDQSRHPATQTYLVYFGPLLGVALSPLTWPLHLILNGQVRTDHAPLRAGKPAAEWKSKLDRQYDP